MKGLRHTVAGELADEGYDERAIADFLGHKTIESARHYSRRATREKKVTAMVLHMDQSRNEKRPKVVKPT